MKRNNSKKDQSIKATVQLPEFDIHKMVVPIIGTSPLVMNKFSEKMKTAMREKQEGLEVKNKKHEVRKPMEEVEAARHRGVAGWEGFPASGFKAAIIRGGKMIGQVMKDAQTSIFIVADCEETQLVKIEGKSRMRTDMVRIGMGIAQVRYRPEYPQWSAKLVIEFNRGMISREQILQMIRAGGYGCGIGEMRPEKTKMQFGRFDIDIKALNKLK